MGFYGPLKISFFDRPAIMVDPSHRQHRYSLGFIPSMEKQSPKPVCGQEALQLLNCVTESSFDQEKCLRFLQSLRECVLSQKVNKFSIPSQDQDSEGAASATTRPS